MTRTKTISFGFLLMVGLSLGAFSAQAQSLGTVNFQLDSDQLEVDELEKIAEIAEKMNEYQTLKPTVVIGFTDATGASAYNQDLGYRRAQQVQNTLLAAGVPKSRIGSISSRGENELLISVATAQRANRRVTVELGDILAACPSYRKVALDASSVGEALQNDLTFNLNEAITNYQVLTSSGTNAAAYQMAGAARSDCEQAVGFKSDSIRKVEYAKKCFCSHARMQTALGN